MRTDAVAMPDSLISFTRWSIRSGRSTHIIEFLSTTVCPLPHTTGGKNCRNVNFVSSEPRQYRSCNTQGHFDSPKSPESCVNPEMTRENTNSGLAVYLTVQNPKQGRINGNRMESDQVPMLAHVLENKAHEGSNQQEVVQSVNCLDCDNGEATVQLANIALLLRRLAPPKITQKFHYRQNA